MSRNQIFYVLVLMLLSSLPCIAENVPDFYLGGGIGMINVNVDKNNTLALSANLSNQAKIDTSLTAARIFGGLEVSEQLWVEGEVLYSEDLTAHQGAVTEELFAINGFSITGLFKIPLEPRLRLNARAGLQLWDLNDYLDTPVGNGSDFTLGLSLDYIFDSTSTTALRLSWDYYDFDDRQLSGAHYFSINLFFRTNYH